MNADDRLPFEELPILASGLTGETYATSVAAAVAVVPTKDTQRERVYREIQRSDVQGRTDDELQDRLDLDGSSERPRRWELWKQDRIQVKRDADGHAVRRSTRMGARAVVWVVV